MQQLYPALKQRCRADLRLASILFLGVFAMVGILPFAAYRAATGNWIMAAVDAALVVGIGACVAAAVRGASTERLGNAIAVVVSAAVLLTTALLGQAGLFWVFPVLLSVFMLTGRRIALACVAGILLGSHLLPILRGAQPLPVSFFVAGGLVSLFGFVFVALHDAQRGDLQALAARDPLTGAFNRRSMERELALAAALHQRQGRSAALAVLDIDHFKRINDLHGHEAGDRALMDLVAILGQVTRRGDTVFRMGGEEFVLLLPDTDRSGADVLLRKVHASLRAGMRSADAPIGTSIGVAMLDAETASWTHWLRDADAALYQAKQSGRDRICFHAPVEASPRPRHRADELLQA